MEKRRLLIIGILSSMFILGGCFKESSEIEKQASRVRNEAGSSLVQTGSLIHLDSVQTGGQTWTIAQTGILEDTIWANEQNSTWPVDISWSVDVDSDDLSKPFNLDDYFENRVYSIIKKERNGKYVVYTIDPLTASWKIDENWNPSCRSDCVNFIVKDQKLIYTNLDIEEQRQYLKEEIGGLYRMYSHGAVFSNLSVVDWVTDGSETTGLASYVFTYIDFWSTQKIYEDYTEETTCTIDTNKDCQAGTKKTVITKAFYKDQNLEDRLSLKATNIKDAYLEYYGELKIND